MGESFVTVLLGVLFVYLAFNAKGMSYGPFRTSKINRLTSVGRVIVFLTGIAAIIYGVLVLQAR